MTEASGILQAAPETQMLEDEAQDFIAALWRVVGDSVWLWPELAESRFTAEEVDDLDRLYSRVRDACIRMNRALVARQTGRD